MTKLLIHLCSLLIATAAAATSADSPLTTALWRLDMTASADLQIEGAVVPGVTLEGGEHAASLARGGDGAAAQFDGGIARIKLPPKLKMSASGLTWCIRVKPAGNRLDGGLFIGAGLPLNVELAAWHIPWGDRWNLGYFQSTPGRVAHAPMNEKQDTGWLDVIVRVHPPSFQPPKPANKTFAGWTEIFVNGQLRVRRPYTGPNSGYAPHPVAGLVLGRDWNDRRFHGLMDHVAVWPRTLTDAEIGTLSGVASVDTSLPAETIISGWHQEVGEGFFPASVPRQERLAWIRDHAPPMVARLREKDPAYPRFHLSPPGFSYNTHLFYHRGAWHMFPTVCMGGSGFLTLEQLSWMHLSSTDLIHWQTHPALIAEAEFDPNAAFYYDAQGKASVVAGGFKPFVMHAVARDPLLEHWDIQPKPPRPAGTPFTRERHDPAVFRHQGQWYLAASVTGRERTTAQIHLYRSENGTEWKYMKLLHEAKVGTGLQECLVAFMLPDDILVLSANKALAPGHTYIVGRFQNENFTLLGSGVSDYGHNAQSGEKRPYNMLHGSQTPAGRTLIWQWQGQTAHPRDLTAQGWSSCYSLPREMTLRPDRSLAFHPAAELEKLRGQPRHLLSTKAATGNTIAPKTELPGESELHLSFKPAPQSRIGWRIGPADHGLTLHYDTAQQQLRVSVDPAVTHPAYDGPFTAPCAPAADGTVTLRLFLDRSMVEIYTPEGNVISTWAFFKDPAHNLLTALRPSTESTLVSATLWPMSPLHWSKANP